ncbi:MAG: branched-chain amino acid ABC transporter permease [Chloroflexota bacterium]|nr:branched-chain amino acid ABC transporter permease [Chloroflexota bacterium]
MATMKAKTTNSGGLFAFLQNPLYAGIFIAVYILLSLGILMGLDRASTIFPLLSMIFFPPFVLAPFVVLASGLNNRVKLAIIAIQMLILLPLLGIFDSAYLELAIQICIFAGLALGLNIVVGFAGLLDLGYIAFFAVGAYIWAMFTSPIETVFTINNWTVSANWFYGFVFLGVLASGIAGILLGLPVLRLRGDYLAIVTLGFGEIIRIVANNLGSPTNITNGSQGLDTVSRPSADFLHPVVEFFERVLNQPVANVEPLAYQLLFYFIAIVMIVVIIIIARRLENSPIGRAWTAIREDETAAIAMGVPLTRMKLMAFASGAAFAGALGALYAAKQTFVSPESFSLIQSISILAMVIVGGLGGIRGVLLGGVVVTLLNLLVLKNLSLQINAWKNVDAVIPGWFIILFAVIIGLALLYFAWRAIQTAVKRNEGWTSYIIPGIMALLGVYIAISSFGAQDFPIANWPSQLEPARYERLVFGVLLVLMMIFRPGGLLPEPRRKMEMADAKAEQKAVAPAAGD